MEQMGLGHVACICIEFCVRKMFWVCYPECGGILSWFDKLLQFPFSANRVNVRVAF